MEKVFISDLRFVLGLIQVTIAKKASKNNCIGTL